MIPVNELRRGSLFYPLSRYTEIHMPAHIAFKVMEIKAFSVTAILQNEQPVNVNKWNAFAIADISPIPLSPEILEKCTFGEFSNYQVTYNKESPGRHVYWLQDKREGIYFSKQVTYLHQLQNIVYYLDGEELTINL